MSNLNKGVAPLWDRVQRNGKWSVLLMSPLLALVFFAAGVVAGHVTAPSNRHVLDSTPAQHAQTFRVFWEAWSRIEQTFYTTTPLQHREMTYGAIRGMLAALGDRHTLFVEPPQHRLQTDAFQGGFGGIGVTISIKDQRPVIVEVSLGSAADRAGLWRGDVLLSVDGTEVSALALDTVVLLVRGPVGSRVELNVQRSDGQQLSFSVVRERIELPSLTWQVLPDSIGYVHILFFSGLTGQELSRAIKALSEEEVRALVLDLRANGGGVVEGASDVLGQLIGHGIAFRELSNAGEERRHPIPFRSQTVDWPLAVLVDRGTASSAEIVAAAIRDHERGVLIGEPTFGKGSVQGIFPLQDGSSVHVTISRWLSANGLPIEGVGLQPDIAVTRDEGQGEGDLILERAMEHLRLELKDATRMRVPAAI
jgi:carboxyl-terminal processing protease